MTGTGECVDCHCGWKQPRSNNEDIQYRLYCDDCGNYLMVGTGECIDCSCGWKQPRIENDE